MTEYNKSVCPENTRGLRGSKRAVLLCNGGDIVRNRVQALIFKMTDSSYA